MRQRWFKRIGGLFLAGASLLQGCPLSADDIQVAAAGSVELFLTDLFTTAITEWIDVAFDVDE